MDILLTGASGFLGRIIQAELGSHRVIKLGRSAGHDIIADLRSALPPLPQVDVVVHAAGKAHVVPVSIAEEKQFFDVNVSGTENLLKALEPNLPASFVFISSVSVYGLDEGQLISETSPLNATTAYGRSKIEAERIITAWCAEHAVTCTILRLPLVAGAHPVGNLKSMVDGIRNGYYFDISGSEARKSIVWGADVAQIIPAAAHIGGVYHLTDGQHPTFKELSRTIAKQLHKKQPGTMPLFLAKSLALCGDLIGKKFPLNSDKLHKMRSELTFSDEKAREKLGWKPQSVVERFTIY